MGNKPARQPNFIPEDNDSSTMPFLTLSIFILLLAFFVVLNTNSEFETRKSSTVLESLEKQFSTNFYGPTRNSVTVDNKSNAGGQGSALEQLEALLTSASISFQLHKVDGEGVFFITLKKQDFEIALSQVINGMIIQGQHQKGKVFERYLALFTQIAAMTMISPDKKALQYHMSILLHVKETTSIKPNDSKTLSKYKEQLQTVGLTQKNLSFGLKPINDDNIELYFKRQNYK